ncbi:golgi snap receptor complex member 2 [Anaeramoeba ignava]|uniref:Golgi snap receptor complex member 2 n=1 Tax=Anaeramoeba ignava TaxID=1746090 RepID=A0A9Q0LT62_ANAIG|nr:golgi snap receptor complex member 2 [Anaeramoeba ignava]
MNLETLWKEGKQGIFQLESLLEHLERSSEISPDSRKEVEEKLRILTQIITSSQTLLERTIENKELWRIRISEMNSKFFSLQNSINSLFAKYQEQQQEKKERDELFESIRLRRNQEIEINVGTLLSNEDKSLTRSEQKVENIFQVGSGILEKLAEQKDRLKNSYKKVSLISGSLGIARNTLDWIRDRNISDRRIVIGGMIITLLIFWLLWKYWIRR